MNIVIALGILVTLATGVPVLLQMLRNHPRGLIILFFAEMWERFSYYGMRGILIFYLTQHFLFDDETAAAQYGSYTSLVYLLPLLGGLLADRCLGTRKAVAFGALLLVAGHGRWRSRARPATQTLTYAGQSYEVGRSKAAWRACRSIWSIDGQKLRLRRRRRGRARRSRTCRRRSAAGGAAARARTR